METCSEVLSFDSGDKILRCEHLIETSSVVLSCGSIFFFQFFSESVKYGSTLTPNSELRDFS